MYFFWIKQNKKNHDLIPSFFCFSFAGVQFIEFSIYFFFDSKFGWSLFRVIWFFSWQQKNNHFFCVPFFPESGDEGISPSLRQWIEAGGSGEGGREGRNQKTKTVSNSNVFKQKSKKWQKRSFQNSFHLCLRSSLNLGVAKKNRIAFACLLWSF